MSGGAIELSLLGVPEARLASTQEAVPLPENAFAIAAYILLRGKSRSLSRRAAGSLLWEKGAAESNANLRQLIARVRRQQSRAGFELFTFDQSSIRIGEPPIVDALRLRDLSMTCTKDAALEVCRLYRGDLLQSYDRGSPELGDWIRTERQTLRNRFIGCLTGFLIQAPETDAAVQEIAHAVIHHDPSQEVAWRALMRVDLVRGDVLALHRTFLECRDTVRAETGTSLHPETVQYYEALCRESRIAPIGDREQEQARPSVATIAPDRSPEPTPGENGVPRICLMPPSSSPRGVAYAIAASVMEDLTTELCRLRTITPIASHTAWRLGEPDQAAIERCGIDYLVRSAVHLIGAGRRIAVQLVNARTRDIVWAEQFPCQPADVAAGYRTLSMQILKSLSASIEHHELARYAAGRPPTAYFHYLLGLKELRVLSLPTYRRARGQFRRSVEADPSFGPAWGALARTYQREWLLLARSDEGLLDQAEQLSRKAIDVDPDGVHGLHQLGQCSLFRGRIDDCLHQYSEAERRSPNYADLIADHAGALGLGIDPVLALQKLDKAMTLNPLCPDYYYWAQGIALYGLERYGEAAIALEQIKQPGPALRMLAASHAMAGNAGEARRFVRKTFEIYPDFRIADWLKTFPFPSPTFRAAYETGLLAAGFH
jgi:DNA-binding SARP family transcriptional activator/tetratricopeptide (TPR) repeat protein